MSDTPRTDVVAKALADFWNEGVTNTTEVVPADWARQLERELAEAKATIARQTKYAEAVAQAVDKNSYPTCLWWPACEETGVCRPECDGSSKPGTAPVQSGEPTDIDLLAELKKALDQKRAFCPVSTEGCTENCAWPCKKLKDFKESI